MGDCTNGYILEGHRTAPAAFASQSRKSICTESGTLSFIQLVWCACLQSPRVPGLIVCSYCCLLWWASCDTVLYVRAKSVFHTVCVWPTWSGGLERGLNWQYFYVVFHLAMCVEAHGMLSSAWCWFVSSSLEFMNSWVALMWVTPLSLTMWYSITPVKGNT